MSTYEAEARKRHLAEVKAALQAAMQKLPFDFNSAGATRIQAWKTACHDAQKLLNRSPQEAWKYEEALRTLQACGNAPVDKLAIEMHGSITERAISATR